MSNRPAKLRLNNQIEHLNTKTKLNNFNRLSLRTGAATEPTEAAHGDGILRTRCGQFKKGHSANPGGRPKQIFHTSRPWRQALMRELRDRSDKSGVDELQRLAARLIDEALTGAFPMAAIKEIGNRLDGPAQAEPAPAQQNTVQIILQSIRALNLTRDQREALRQLVSPTSSVSP